MENYFRKGMETVQMTRSGETLAMSSREEEEEEEEEGEEGEGANEEEGDEEEGGEDTIKVDGDVDVEEELKPEDSSEMDCR